MAFWHRWTRFSQTGFTLLELILVLGVITTLSTVLLGAGRWAQESGKNARAQAELATIVSGLESYRRMFGDYPQTDDSATLLQSLIGRRGPAGAATATGEFVQRERLTTAAERDPLTDPRAQWIDPWDHPYAYAYKSMSPWLQPRYVLYSYGRDGVAAALLAGGRPDDSATINADNVYANR
ncbi:MAG: type II secretion system protein GspG [Opitutus sp.]